MEEWRRARPFPLEFSGPGTRKGLPVFFSKNIGRQRASLETDNLLADQQLP